MRCTLCTIPLTGAPSTAWTPRSARIGNDGTYGSMLLRWMAAPSIPSWHPPSSFKGRSGIPTNGATHKMCVTTCRHEPYNVAMTVSTDDIHRPLHASYPSGALPPSVVRHLKTSRPLQLHPPSLFAGPSMGPGLGFSDSVAPTLIIRGSFHGPRSAFMHPPGHVHWQVPPSMAGTWLQVQVHTGRAEQGGTREDASEPYYSFTSNAA